MPEWRKHPQKGTTYIAVKARCPWDSLLCISKTYLLRQIINADVDGCGAFGSLGLEVDVDEDVDATGVGGIVGSAESPPVGLLFFLFAIC